MRPIKHLNNDYIINKSFSVAAVMKPYFNFAQSFIRSPRQIGAICPSSGSLAMALVRASALTRDELIIDLGAGTGAVTGKLLKEGVFPESIVAVEQCKPLADAFRRKYPGVPVLQADARNLDALLESLMPGKSVRTIISSLPFRTLPSPACAQITGKIKDILEPQGGTLVQFSYAWWMRYPLRRYGFVPLRRRFVLRNLPPAVVEVYTVPKRLLSASS